MKTLILSFLVLMAIGGASQAQSIQQSGAVTPGHLSSWATNGVVQDAGAASNGNVSSLGITATGLPFCINDAKPTSLAGYHQLCMGANSLGAGLLTYNAFGGASPLSLDWLVNGQTYEFPFAIGGIVGPGSTTSGDMASWNNSSGTLLADTGNSFSKPGPTWASPGTTIYDAFRMSVNNFPIGAQFGNNAVALVEGVVGAIEVPSSATGGNATFGIAGYGRTASTTTGAVGTFGGGSANADGVSSWGGNFLVTNAPLLSPSVGTGHIDTVGYGVEIDVNLATASGDVAPTSAMRGLYIIGASQTAPANGLDAVFEAIGIDSPGVNQSPHIKWNNAIYTYDGATGTAYNIGTSETGNNVGSQSLNFRGRDSGAVEHIASIQSSAFGDVVINPTSGAATFLAGSVNAINVASAVNEVSLYGAATGNPVEVLASGSDSIVGLTLGTKGAGNFLLSFNADSSPVTAMILGKAGTGANGFSFQTASSGNPALLGTLSGPLGLGSSTGFIQFVSTNSWTTNGSTAVTVTSLGPSGAHTTIQEWLTIVDAGGNTRYIPAY